MQRALSVDGNEYAVTDAGARNPRAMTMGVSPCIGVALMLRDPFNTAAVGHFFVHAQTLGNPREALKAYVGDGFRRMLDDLHWHPGKQLRAGIVGGDKDWEESALLSEFVHASLRKLEGIEIVFDHSLRGKLEDIVADCKAGIIRPMSKDDMRQTVFDCRDFPRWSYSGPAHFARLEGIRHSLENPAGSRLFRHPQSIPA